MQRPLPSGHISALQAATWASSIGLAGTALLVCKTNMLLAGLGASNLALYAFVCTPLKQIHTVNTWVGDVVGAIPPLLGWAAASGQVTLNSMILPAALYFWNIPHFMSLAYLLRNDYTAGGLIRSLRNSSKAPISIPSFSLYDQINLIDNVPDDQLRFQSFTDTGFMVNGVNYEGSLLTVGNLLTSWSPKKFSEVTPESLSIFQVMRPIPEILILGCGRYIEMVHPGLRQFVRSTGMKMEVLDSRNAASTYNILNEEGRIVAAALLPYVVNKVCACSLISASLLCTTM